MTDYPVVSHDDEMLILVDPQDQVLGYETKDACHRGEGRLHRAFSVFLFNERGELLLQQRSGQKPLWPLTWSNSCCSHPRRHEEIEGAAHRRVREELGVETELEYLYKFQYQAQYEDKGSENELCSVLIGRCRDEIVANPNEVAALRFITVDDLDVEFRENADAYTPWFKMEWARLREDFAERIQSYATPKPGASSVGRAESRHE